MVEVKRKKGETFESMLRRMQNRFQASGRQREVKRRRFLQRRKNQTKRRASALRRVHMSDQFAYLSKTGQLPEDPKKRNVRR